MTVHKNPQNTPKQLKPISSPKSPSCSTWKNPNFYQNGVLLLSSTLFASMESLKSARDKNVEFKRSKITKAKISKSKTPKYSSLQSSAFVCFVAVLP